MFRNDPLESLKVSSTFDAIPFVRDYLQKEIEGQLRTLLMDEVPAIIHRLSLRLWVPEFKVIEDEELARNDRMTTPEEVPVDPLASPPQDPVDISGNILDPSQIASLSLDSGLETHSLFSQKNLIRLAALTESQRTLSLFTPGIRDVVFRAWAGPSERGELSSSNGLVTPVLPTMSRVHSFVGKTSNTYTFSEPFDAGTSSRPTLSSFGSATTGLTVGANRQGKTHGGRNKKHRIVNLRRKSANGDRLESVSGEGSTLSGTTSSTPSMYSAPLLGHEREGELVTPPQSPPRTRSQKDRDGAESNTPFRSTTITPCQPLIHDTNGTTPRRAEPNGLFQSSSPSRRPRLRTCQTYQPTPSYPLEKHPAPETSQSSSQGQSPSLVSPFQSLEPNLGRIAEQAWMMKMIGEIARRAHDEKATDNGFWQRDGQGRDETPPPAYGL